MRLLHDIYVQLHILTSHRFTPIRGQQTDDQAAPCSLGLTQTSASPAEPVT